MDRKKNLKWSKLSEEEKAEIRFEFKGWHDVELEAMLWSFEAKPKFGGHWSGLDIKLTREFNRFMRKAGF